MARWPRTGRVSETRDEAAPTIQQALDGKVSGGRRLKVALLKDTRGIATCQIFFFSRAAKVQPDEVLRQAKGSATGTVGELDGFCQRGGIISFVRKQESFRFDVNLGAAENAGLKVSARLANMATIVQTSLP